MRIGEPQTLLMRIGEPQGDTRPDETTKWANSAQKLAATWSWSGLGWSTRVRCYPQTKSGILQTRDKMEVTRNTSCSGQSPSGRGIRRDIQRTVFLFFYVKRSWLKRHTTVNNQCSSASQYKFVGFFPLILRACARKSWIHIVEIWPWF